MNSYELVESNPHLYSLLEKLRNTVTNFAVIDRQGQILGEVSNLILDDNCQINLVVSQLSTVRNPGLFLLISELIEKIDYPDKSVFVNVNAAEIANFPEYVNTEKLEIKLPEISNSPASPAFETVNEGIKKDEESTVSTSDRSAEAIVDNAMALQSFDLLELEEVESTEALSDHASTLDLLELEEIESTEVPTDNELTLDFLEQGELEEVESIEVPNDNTLALDLLEEVEEIESTEVPNDNPRVIDIDLPEVSEGRIRILAERLVVARNKGKLGEIVVRKEIETRMIQVPVRREKLIVEQVSPESRQLANTELGQAIELNSPENTESQQPKTVGSVGDELLVTGEFGSPKIASLLLNSIALERYQGYKKVRVKIVTEDAESQKTYQEWFNRFADDKNINLK